MKPYDRMLGSELIAFYKFCCDELENTIKRLKESLNDKRFRTEETFYGYLVSKTENIKALHTELRQRLETQNSREDLLYDEDD